jgi:Patatin-like phospholipase
LSWRLIGRTLRLVFFLRVPLLTLLVLSALGPVAYSSSFLSNLLDQGTNGWYLFTVSFAAFLLAFTALATLNLVLHYGNNRFDEGTVLDLSQRRPLLTFVCGCAAATTLDVFVYLRTVPRVPANAAILFLGSLAALALVIIAKVAQLALTDPASTPHPPPFLVFPAYLVRPAERMLDDIYCWSSPTSKKMKRHVNAVSQWPLQVMCRAGQGYLIETGSPDRELKLASGHVFALSLFLAAFASYLGIGIAKSSITNEEAQVPALAFVLLFLIVACWALASLTFFFDRYRFPLLWTIAALSLVTALTPISDHFFRVETRLDTFPEGPTASEYLQKQIALGRKRLVFIATPGGGIQAAAWTAKVLSGLDHKTSGFRKSVAVISSVSGGSLGSIIYAASFAQKIKPEQAAANARRSAIDEVAWGWTVPDFWRVIFPWFRRDRTLDRGWALEKKWSAVNNLGDTGGTQGTMLSEWSTAARAGTMPALLINAMLVERGQPIVFSTTRFPRRYSPDNRIMNFYDMYPDQRGHYDLRVNTAARLSASFPYVAPASRPNLNAPYGNGFHIVDGGYYDNFGMNSLLAWLREGFEDTGVQANLTDVLILQIRHFTPHETFVNGTSAGWAFQLIAPLEAIFHMRDFAQDTVARNELELFGEYYATRKVQIWETSIGYSGTGACTEAPLSWKLDQNQQKCIDTAWERVLEDQKPALSCINSFVSNENPGPYCGTAANPKDP